MPLPPKGGSDEVSGGKHLCRPRWGEVPEQSEGGGGFTVRRGNGGKAIVAIKSPYRQRLRVATSPERGKRRRDECNDFAATAEGSDEVTGVASLLPLPRKRRRDIWLRSFASLRMTKRALRVQRLCRPRLGEVPEQSEGGGGFTVKQGNGGKVNHCYKKPLSSTLVRCHFPRKGEATA